MTIECKDGVIHDQTIRAWGTGPLSTAVQLPVQAVRACFEGPMVERAAAVASLTAVQRVRLFPGRRQRHGRNLARIGRRLTGETVRAELRHAPCGALFAAAMHRDEQTQIREAIRWRLRRRPVPIPRRRVAHAGTARR